MSLYLKCASFFRHNDTSYDVKNDGVANPGAVLGLSKIIGLIHDGILPKSAGYSRTEELMGQGKIAMIILHGQT